MKRIEKEGIKKDLLLCSDNCGYWELHVCLHPYFSKIRQFMDAQVARKFPLWCPLPDVEGDYTCPTCNKTYNSLQMAVSCCYEGHGLTPIE